MKLTDIQEHNITNEELDVINMYIDGLSDMDMAYNPETGEYDLFAIEWDGMYGRHWQYFNTEEERQARLDRHSAEQLAFLPEARKIIAEQKREKQRIGEEKAAKKRALREAKTLGGQHPELAALLDKMRKKSA